MGSKSPPHPTRLRRPTFPPRGRLWVEKNPASQTSGPRKGRNKIQSVFCTDTRRAKKLCSPRECQLRWRGSGCIPQFWEPSAAGPKIPAPPSPPSRWAGRYGRWIMGRRPGKKEGGPPQGPPKLEKVGPGRKNLFLPGVLSSGFLPKKAGPPPGAGRATGRCAPRHRKSPTHPQGTQYRPQAPGPTWRAQGRRPQKINLQTSIFNSIIKSR